MRRGLEGKKIPAFRTNLLPPFNSKDAVALFLRTLYLLTSLRDVTTQNTTCDIFIAVRTSNFMQLLCQKRSPLTTSVLWNTAPCSPLEIYRRFTCAFCFCHQGHHQCSDDGGTSETSVDFYQTTRRNITEGCHLHTSCR
jgi:hypothetical protein